MRGSSSWAFSHTGHTHQTRSDRRNTKRKQKRQQKKRWSQAEPGRSFSRKRKGAEDTAEAEAAGLLCSPEAGTLSPCARRRACRPGGPEPVPPVTTEPVQKVPSPGPEDEAATDPRAKNPDGRKAGGRESDSACLCSNHPTHVRKHMLGAPTKSVMETHVSPGRLIVGTG